jgi:Subtilase family
MTRVAQLRLMGRVLVSIVRSGRGAIAARAADLSNSLSVLHGTPLIIQQTVVVQSATSVLQIFSPIHALAIQLPALTADQALAFLLSNPLGVVESIAPPPPPSRSASPGDCSRSRCRPSISSGGAECLGLSTTGAAPLTAVTYPAADLCVLAVVATDSGDHVTADRPSGSQRPVLAPGGHPTSGQILAPNRSGDHGEGSSTNQGAAYVTGAMALALPPQPQLSVEEGRQALPTTATNLTDPSIGLPSPSMHQGAGRIDGKNMVQALLPEAKPPGRSRGGDVTW